METDNMLTSSDIIDIIRACNKNRVRKFELGNLKIKLDEPTEIVSSPKKRSSWRNQVLETSNNTPEQLELEEMDVIQLELKRAQLALTDPSAFEEFQLEGEENADQT